MSLPSNHFDAPDACPRPTTLQLARVFLQLGATGFGGMLPMARRMIVERKRWLTEEEFVELLGPGQFLPGATVVNLSIAIGARLGGTRAGLVSVCALLAAPTGIVLLMGALYGEISDDPRLGRFLAGVAAAAAGLFIAMAIRLLPILRGKPAGAAIAALCVFSLVALRAPLLTTLLALGPVSILVAWKARP